MFVIVVCFALEAEAACFAWSHDNKTVARYETRAACEREVAKIETFIDKTAADKRKEKGFEEFEPPPHVAGCKEVTLNDAEHT